MDRYTFESRESYEKAVKEEELIQQLKKKADLNELFILDIMREEMKNGDARLR